MSNPYILKLTNEEYHLRPELSCTGLKELARSPAHYQNYVHGDRHATPAMILGSYFHSVILEPEIATSDYVVAPEGMSFATKEGKQWKSENEGKQIIKFEDSQMIDSMKNQVRNSPMCNGLLSFGGEAESSIFWTDDETGVLCKNRCDYLNHDMKTIIDLKTTADASPEKFQKSSWDLNYHLQGAFYQRGVMELTGEYYDWLIIAIEKDNPYIEPVIYKFSESLLSRGDEKVNELLKQFAECQRTDIWNGYPEGILELEIPAWVKE